MFKPLKLGTNHMLGQDSYVPLTTNNFEIRIYGMDGSAPSEFADLLTLSTDEVGEIQEDQDSITVHYGNGLIKFPSKVDYADVDWTFLMYLKLLENGGAKYMIPIPKGWDCRLNT